MSRGEVNCEVIKLMFVQLFAGDGSNLRHSDPPTLSAGWAAHPV